MLAAEFNRDEARHAVRRAVRALACCVAVTLAAAWLALRGVAPGQPWPSGPVFYPAYGLLTEVASAGVLNALLLTVVAPRLGGVPLEGRLARLAVRSIVVACAALVPVALVAAGNLGGSTPLAERLLLGVVAAGVTVTAALASPPYAVLPPSTATVPTPGRRLATGGQTPGPRPAGGHRDAAGPARTARPQASARATATQFAAVLWSWPSSN